MLGRLIAHLAIMCVIGLKIIFLCFYANSNKQTAINPSHSLHICTFENKKDISTSITRSNSAIWKKNILCAFSSRILLLFGMYY